MNHKEIRRYIGKMKARQSRGSGWMQMLINIGVISANIKLFEGAIPVSLPVALVVGGIGYVVLTVYIGYFDEIYGIWKEETEFNSSTVNPVTQRIDQGVKRIEERLTK
jgi:hypothetical protein